MTDWRDSAQEIADLLLRYLRPMVEGAEEQRAAEKERQALRKVMGEDSGPSLHGFPFAGVGLTGYDPAYTHQPWFSMKIDDCECIVRDDGAVFFYSESIGQWCEHSTIPGTPAARPKAEGE